MPTSKRKRASTNTHESDGEGDRDGDFVAEEEVTEEPVPPTQGVADGCPYMVDYRKADKKAAAKAKAKQAKKQKTGPTTNNGPPPKQILDQDLPEDTTVYTVKPKRQWDSLKKYRNFVVGDENFALNEYIYVNNGKAPGSDPELEDQQFWVARVLEIRAVDEAHVYLRVYWLYWPEELPGGRQPYHGQRELIASNHMDIIDAMTVGGRAHVKHWMELDEDEELPELYWRQKFDYPSKTLMEVREHCRCHRYYNPDKLMYGCPHCKTWLHEECVQEELKRKAYAKLLEEEGEEKLRTLLAGLDLEPAEPKPAPKKGKKAAATANGKGKGPASIKDVKNPTIEMLDKIFDVFITVNSGGTATKALIRDIRPAEGEEETKQEEDEPEDEEGEDDEDDEEVKKERRKKRKARREWEEDVMCLCCGEAIY